MVIHSTEQNSPPKQKGDQGFDYINHSRFRRQATDGLKLMISDPMAMSPKRLPWSNQSHVLNTDASLKEIDEHIPQESFIINPEKIFCENQDTNVQSQPYDGFQSYFAQSKTSGDLGNNSKINFSISIRGSKEISNSKGTTSSKLELLDSKVNWTKYSGFRGHNLIRKCANESMLMDLKNGNGLSYGYGASDSPQYALRLLGQDSLSSSFDLKDQVA